MQRLECNKGRGREPGELEQQTKHTIIIMLCRAFRSGRALPGVDICQYKFGQLRGEAARNDIRFLCALRMVMDMADRHRLRRKQYKRQQANEWPDIIGRFEESVTHPANLAYS